MPAAIDYAGLINAYPSTPVRPSACIAPCAVNAGITNSLYTQPIELADISRYIKLFIRFNMTRHAI